MDEKDFKTPSNATLEVSRMENQMMKNEGERGY